MIFFMFWGLFYRCYLLLFQSLLFLVQNLCTSIVANKRGAETLTAKNQKKFEIVKGKILVNSSQERSSKA